MVRRELEWQLLESEGREVLLELALRGLWVRLQPGGELQVGPARRVSGRDRELVAAHREAVEVALTTGQGVAVFALDSSVTAADVACEQDPQETSREMCPACHVMDYLPLGGGWRRCWRCGRRWGPAGTEDPGDPPDLERLRALLGIRSVPLHSRPRGRSPVVARVRC